MEWFEQNWAWAVVFVIYIGLYRFGFGGQQDSGDYDNEHSRHPTGGNIRGTDASHGHRH